MIFWRAVRGSARVLAQGGNKVSTTKFQRPRGFGFCLGEPGARAPGPLVRTGNQSCTAKMRRAPWLGIARLGGQKPHSPRLFLHPWTGSSNLFFIFWRAVRGSARVLTQTGNICLAREGMCSLDFMVFLQVDVEQNPVLIASYSQLIRCKIS